MLSCSRCCLADVVVGAADEDVGVDAEATSRERREMSTHSRVFWIFAVHRRIMDGACFGD